jgi:hypothetical protein
MIGQYIRCGLIMAKNEFGCSSALLKQEGNLNILMVCADKKPETYWLESEGKRLSLGFSGLTWVRKGVCISSYTFKAKVESCTFTSY